MAGVTLTSVSWCTGWVRVAWLEGRRGSRTGGRGSLSRRPQSVAAGRAAPRRVEGRALASARRSAAARPPSRRAAARSRGWAAWSAVGPRAAGRRAAAAPPGRSGCAGGTWPAARPRWGTCIYTEYKQIQWTSALRALISNITARLCCWVSLFLMHSQFSTDLDQIWHMASFSGGSGNWW